MAKGQYTYDYPRPMVVVDAAVFTVRDGRLEILLIKRKHEPFKDMWALPGGFVEIDETLEDAVARELAEETGVTGVSLRQHHTFGALDRDPRGRVITVAYFGIADWRRVAPQAADDAAGVAWLPVDALPPLASDHSESVACAVGVLKLLLKAGNSYLDWLPETVSRKELEQAINAPVSKPS